MKLVWSPEMASQAYIDTVKACNLYSESSVAEFLSAMAAGWNAKLIVETWSSGGAVATSIGLAVARRSTGGRHVCIVSNEESRGDYIAAMAESGSVSLPEFAVGEVKEVMGGLEGIDFMVVDCMISDFENVFRVARLGQRGAVLIGKNACSRDAPDFKWRCVLDGKSRIVRSVMLPVGKGLDIAHVGAHNESSGVKGKVKRRWIKYVDQRSGEEHFIRM